MKFARNPQVEWLMSHAYGQGGTVALPNARSVSTSHPRGDFPAGVQDILNRLADQYIDWPKLREKGEDVEWCFLVGGPGNGKSEALRDLAELLDIELPRRTSGQPSPRTVPSNWPSEACALPSVPGINIVFINDASIPRQEAIGQERLGSLHMDLVDGINWLLKNDTSVVIFANINRGILVEEAAKANKKIGQENNIGLLAGEIVKWLLEPPSDLSKDNDNYDQIQTVIPVESQRPYYGQVRVLLSALGSKSNIKIHVVFLDTLSLLEPLPGGNVNKAIDFSSDPPTVENYLTFGGFFDERGASRERTVAGRFLTDIVNPVCWENSGCLNSESTLCAAYYKCPFVQNAKWLRSVDLQRRFLDILRAAEVTATRRLTYRDLLGHISLALIGRIDGLWLSGVHPCGWVESKYISIEEGLKSAVIDLINHRIYNNLFPSPDLAAWKKLYIQPRPDKDTVYRPAIEQMVAPGEKSRNQSFDLAFNEIDPARDAGYWENGLRENVLEAVESLEIEAPTNQLQNQGVLEADSISELEILLDQAVKDEITTELEISSKSDYRGAPAQRAKLLRKWRNTLLLRHVGLSKGQIAFREVISAWLSEQYNALRNDTVLELGKGIEELLLPRTNTGKLLLVPLRPRTYNLDVGNLPHNTVFVAVDSSNLRIDIVPRGDTLTAEVLRSTRGSRQGPQLLSSVVIDLSIAREAVLRHRCGEDSFTDIGTSAFARIERVRASLVGRELLKQVSVYYTDDLGNIYRITSNPAGPAVLRSSIMEQEL